MSKFDTPEYWKWFTDGKFGLFLHFGPYAEVGRGEQVLFREHMDHDAYKDMAVAWNPTLFDAAQWAAAAKNMGVKYVCLTTRHHDGYCMWDSKYTDYTSMQQAPKRDFVREYAEAFRAQGLKIGLYYSWLDWRLPAFFEGPLVNPQGFAKVKEYLHNQVEELLTNYGKIDYFFFDGAWPRTEEELESKNLLDKMRALQPHIIVNNRLGTASPTAKANADGGLGAGESKKLGDFGTPEHNITADKDRLWESCQVTTWRLWGYARGERWRNADFLLDMLCECVEKGGNMLLNVGPQSDGTLPPEFLQRAAEIGSWLNIHGECIYGAQQGDLIEFVTRGRQTVKGNCLYLIFRFWDGLPTMRIADICNEIKSVTLLTTGQKIAFHKQGDVLYLEGLPVERPTALFPVIRVECEGAPVSNQWGRERLWSGDPQRVADWARQRGEGVNTNGSF